MSLYSSRTDNLFYDPFFFDPILIKTSHNYLQLHDPIQDYIHSISSSQLFKPSFRLPPLPHQKPTILSDLMELRKTPFSLSLTRTRALSRPSYHEEHPEEEEYGLMMGFDQEMGLIRDLGNRISALELGFDEVLDRHFFKKHHHAPPPPPPPPHGNHHHHKKHGHRHHPPPPHRYLKSFVDYGDDRDYPYIYKYEEKGEKGFGYDEEEEEDVHVWKTEFKGNRDSILSASYKYEKELGGKKGKKDVMKEEEKKGKVRVVEIEDGTDAAIAHRLELIAKRRLAAATHSTKTLRGKRKELSPLDAARMIQMTYRAHLVHRAKTARALRELAIAKAKLREYRALFNNFAYRRGLTVDQEERQRFSEKIIVLVLTVEEIQGTDMYVREARRSIVYELEAMLEAIDPQPGKLTSLRRRRFDLPGHCAPSELNKMAQGVAEVVQLLEQE